MTTRTQLQVDVLAFIKQHIAEKGFPPGLIEIAHSFFMKSKSGAARVVDALVECGELRKVAGRRPAYEVVPDKNCPHCGHPQGSDRCRAAAANFITYSESRSSAGCPRADNTPGGDKPLPAAGRRTQLQPGAG